VTAAPTLLPGEVWAVKGGGLAGKLIAIGAALRGLPSDDQHVAVMSHYDAKLIPWGIEGRPGGVGWVDMRKYIHSPYSCSNHDQPIDDATRARLAVRMKTVLGAAYDWQGIAMDAAQSVDPNVKFADEQWKTYGREGHYVCSSYAAWLYAAENVPHPGAHHERLCTPADWRKWNLEDGWKTS
jgi:hypothetical protein